MLYKQLGSHNIDSPYFFTEIADSVTGQNRYGLYSCFCTYNLCSDRFE